MTLKYLMALDPVEQMTPYLFFYFMCLYNTSYSAENKRRTKHIPRSLNPEWHQTIMFQDVPRDEIRRRVLEFTVWDYDRFKANDFLGEVVIDLSGNC